MVRILSGEINSKILWPLACFLLKIKILNIMSIYPHCYIAIFSHCYIAIFSHCYIAIFSIWLLLLTVRQNACCSGCENTQWIRFDELWTQLSKLKISNFVGIFRFFQLKKRFEKKKVKWLNVICQIKNWINMYFGNE